MKTLVTTLTFLLAVLVQAAPVCVDGICYPSEEAARADGVSEALAEARKDKPRSRHRRRRGLVPSVADRYAFLAISTSCLNPSGSRMAISLIIFRFSITPAFARPAMNWL